jgi:hypothetical protein
MDSSDWPPPREASLLDVLLAALARLEGIGVTPWNMWVEPPRTVKVTLSKRPDDARTDGIGAVLEPLRVDADWHEVFVEVAESGTDLDDDDSDDGPIDGCSVCGGPGALRECVLDPSAPPDRGFALASKWHVCAACQATIAAADPDALKRVDCVPRTERPRMRTCSSLVCSTASTSSALACR